MLAAKVMPDRLVAEADTQDGTAPGENAEDVERHARLARRAGSGGKQDTLGIQRERLLHGDLVVAEDLLLHAELAKVLHQVVGEGVVVIDDQEHGLTICLARRSVKESPKRVNKCGAGEVVRNATSQGRKRRPTAATPRGKPTCHRVTRAPTFRDWNWPGRGQLLSCIDGASGLSTHSAARPPEKEPKRFTCGQASPSLRTLRIAAQTP